MTEELPVNAYVTKIGYEHWYRGTIWRYEEKFRTRWAVVKWSHLQFTEREYPSALAPVEKT